MKKRFIPWQNGMPLFDNLSGRIVKSDGEFFDILTTGTEKFIPYYNPSKLSLFPDQKMKSQTSEVNMLLTNVCQ